MHFGVWFGLGALCSDAHEALGVFGIYAWYGN